MVIRGRSSCVDSVSQGRHRNKLLAISGSGGVWSVWLPTAASWFFVDAVGIIANCSKLGLVVVYRYPIWHV